MSGNQLPNLERIFKDEDEPDFLPSGRSNLAAIFGTSGKTQETVSSTKQSHRKTNSPHSAQPAAIGKPEVIIATVIYAYKLENGSYGSVGKLGLALTGDTLTRTYQIILYRSKEEHISIVTITHDFVYTVQENNYCSYYDANKDNWTILFNNSEKRDEFAREIGLARYFSKQDKIDSVLYQDLTPAGKNEVAKQGDTVVIRQFVATEIVQPFKNSNAALTTMTVEISSDDNWERALLGCSKGLKRVLFIPPSKQISLGPSFPKERDVMMEIEIMEIEAEAPKAAPGAKASIIQRMAKMGQSMLPKPSTSTTTDSEDTEDDIPPKSPRHKKADTLGLAMQKKNILHESSEEAPTKAHKAMKPRSESSSIETPSPKPMVPATFTPTHQWSPTQFQASCVTKDGQLDAYQLQPIAQTIPTMMDPNLAMFITETRMAHAELRMGMSKIADNVQKLLDKFHVLELQNASTPASERVAMDATLKMLLAMNTQGTAKDNGGSSEFNEMRNRISMLEQELKESREQFKEILTTSRGYAKNLEAERDSLRLMNEKSQSEIKKLEKTLEEESTIKPYPPTDRTMETKKATKGRQQEMNSFMGEKDSESSLKQVLERDDSN